MIKLVGRYTLEFIRDMTAMHFFVHSETGDEIIFKYQSETDIELRKAVRLITMAILKHNLVMDMYITTV